MTQNEIQHVPAEIEGHYRQFTPREVQAMAEFFAKSGFYAMTLDQAISLMFIAQSKGLHPATAMERYHVIKGKPSMKAEAMLAEFQRDGGHVEWIVSTDEKAEAMFYHERHCPKGFAVSFTLADAKRAKLVDNPVWQAHPRNMLRSRVITNGVRMIAPGVILGIYTPDEIEEFTPPEPIEVTAKASMQHQLQERLPIRQRHESVKKTAEAIKAHEEEKAPKTDCRLWIEGTLEAFNIELQKAHPEEKMVTSYQVANAILSAAIADGRTEESELLNNRGKRDPRLAAKEINRLWEADQMAVMRSVGAYLQSKLPEQPSDGEIMGDFPKAG